MSTRTAWRCVLLAASLTLAACAVAPLGHPVPSVSNIAAARSAGLPPMALGKFSLAAGKPASLDQRVMIRSNALHSPYDSSFAAYLKESLAADLRAAGLLDPAAPVVISGELTDSAVDVPAGIATGTIAARFTAARGGVTVYARELRASDSWPAGFVGVEAIPMAVNRYEQLYRHLVARLLGDPELQAALRR